MPTVPFSYSDAALMVVDLQCGFTSLCPEELPIPGALEIVPRVNQLLDRPWKRIDASLDWHPANHCSFLGQRDNLYPPHCVAGTRGAEFVPGLASERIHAIWRKGYHADLEAYAVTAQHPGLLALYRAEGVRAVAICGLATNICCFFAARDFRQAGFDVWLLEDASAGIDIPSSGLYQAKAKAEGMRLGIQYVDSL